MLVNRENLKEALEIVRPGLARKEIITQTTSFAFVDGHVVTYNNEISIRHPVPGIDIRGAVAAEQLYKLLDKLTKEEVEIELINNEVLIKCGRVKAGLAIQEEILLPLKEFEEEKHWYVLTGDFIKGLDFVVRVCSRESSRPLLNCVHVNEAGFVEASDGYRIARFTVPSHTFPHTFLIPAQTVMEIITLAPQEVAWGQGWVHFRANQQTILSCRVFEGVYPNTDSYLLAEGLAVTFPQTMMEVLERAVVFAKRDSFLSESVTVSLAKNRLKMKSEAEAGTGWFEEELNMKYDGKEVQFAITPHLLKDILTSTKDCIIAKGKLKFREETWEYITLLRG